MRWPPGTTNAEKLRFYRHRAASQGLCYTCRCRPKTETSRYCAECLANNDAHERARGARNQKAGLCACGREPRSGWKTCEECAIRAHRGHAKQRDRRDAYGLCRRCAAPRVAGRTQCEACLAINRERVRARRQSKIASGRCGWSGCDRKQKAGHTMCAACLKEMRETGSPKPAARVGRVQMKREEALTC